MKICLEQSFVCLSNDSCFFSASSTKEGNTGRNSNCPQVRIYIFDVEVNIALLNVCLIEKELF